MKSTGQPGQQPRLGGDQIDTGHANLGESQSQACFLHPCHQILAINLSATERHTPIVESPPAAAGDTLREWQWADEAATRATALQLAQQPALRHAFLSLVGDLGAGKTTFARYLLSALGVQGRIKSPTYTVVEPYTLPDLDLWHFDFYRFSDPQEWEDAGFRDIFASPGLKLAEWPDKAHGLLPQPDLELRLQTLTDGTRRVRMQAYTACGRAILQGLPA